MMKNLKLLIAALWLISTVNCERDADIQPKYHPFVTTCSPNVNEQGVEFYADIKNLGNQDIIKYGFVWSEESGPTDLNNSKFFYEEPEKGIYSCSINSGLAREKVYFVRSCIITSQNIVYGNEQSFKSNGSLAPEITSFEPKYGPIGTKVRIEGQNFGLSRTSNLVKFGSTVVTVDSFGEDRLLVTIPNITKTEKVLITLETAGMLATSQDSFDLWFPWLKKSDYSYVNQGAASFSLGNKAYIINCNNNYMFIYDPVKDQWDPNISLPENAGNIPAAFAIGELAYIRLKNYFWEYNPSSGNWINKKSYPGTFQDDPLYSFCFNIGSNIYMGNCYNNYEFWEYNSNLNSWQRKADFSGNIDPEEPVWGNYTFALNNMGFLGISQSSLAINTLWAYDPLSDSWSAKSPLPSNSHASFGSFVIDESAYVGLGRKSDWQGGYLSRKIWEYDIQNDKWIIYHDCPVGLEVKTSFSFNGKGYVIAGSTASYGEKNDIWEFNPAKN